MLEHAVQYWVENNSSDKYNHKNHKVTESGVHKWNYATCAEPTIQQLQDILTNNAIDIARIVQKKKIKKSYENVIETNNGIETSVNGVDELPIIIDNARSDIDNMDKIIQLMENDSMANIQFRDYNNKLQTVTLSQLKTIYFDALRNKLAKHSLKQSKEAAIDAASTIEEINNITFE